MAEVTPEALAAELEAERDAIDVSDYGPLEGAYQRGRITGIDTATCRIRRQLAPAHAALVAERDELARQLADLRTSLDYCAGQWESNAMPHTMPVRQPWQRAIYADCARNLRSALKVNAPEAADVRAERDGLRLAVNAALLVLTSEDMNADSARCHAIAALRAAHEAHREALDGGHG